MKLFKDVDVLYKFRTLPGRKYEVVFDTSIPKNFLSAALTGSLSKLNSEAEADIEDLDSWVADDRLNAKLIKKFSKHIDKIEKGIRSKKAAGFKIITQNIPEGGALFVRNGNFIDFQLIICGEYVL